MGDTGLRDKYIDRALAEKPSAFYQVLLAKLQDKAADLPEAVKDAAVVEVAGDWTTRGGILLDAGRVIEAANVWLRGILDQVDEGRWFTAAYYIKHHMTNLIEPLLELALREAIEQDDLWWQLRCYEELGWTDSARELLLGNEQRIRSEGSPSLLLKLATAKGDHDERLRLTKEIEQLGRGLRLGGVGG